MTTPASSYSGDSQRRRYAQKMLEQGMSNEPIQHWMQGAARMLQSALGGYQMHQLDNEEKKADELLRSAPGLPMLPGAGVESNTGGGVDRIAAALTAPAPTAAPPMPGKIYSNNEPSPLDPPAVAGPRPGGPVMPTAKVWGDAEAENAGIYEPQPASVRMAEALAPKSAVSTGNPVLTSGRTDRMPDKMGQAPQAGAIPQSAPGGGPNIPPQIGAYIQSLLQNPRTRAQGMAMYQKYLKPADYGFTTLPDGTVLRTDSRGGTVAPIYRGQAKPTFGEVGTDPNTGQPVRGFIDPTSRSVQPYQLPGQANAGPSSIPPPPPGVDPKVWREAQSKRASEEGMPASYETTSKLRNEVRGQQTYKRLSVAAPVYSSMVEAAGQNDRAADLNLIYGFATVMDPDSVVRGEEMTMVKAIATLPEQLKNTVASQLDGAGQLSPEVREALMRQARSRVTAYQGQFDHDMKQYRGIAQRGRMNEEDVIPSFGAFQEYKATPKANAVKNALKNKYGLE